MAAGLRSGVGYRDEQPHPPGPQSGGVSVSSVGPASRTAPRSNVNSAIAFCKSRLPATCGYFNVNELDGIDRQFLVERQLISREHSESHGARGVAIDPREQSA